MTRLRRKAAPLTATPLALMCCALMAAACETSDCPINNVVYAKYGFYVMSAGQEVAVKVMDTLTVTAGGTDSVLVNRLTSDSGLDLPLSYSGATDTIALSFTDTLGVVRADTIWIDKENTLHYESPNCPASVFHHITAARCTRRLIDTVTVVNPSIDYNVSENFKIYFRNSD